MNPEKIKKTDPDNKFRRVLSASTLKGDRVRNFAGDELGLIEEIMIDIPSGKVAYAVLSYGGVLGVGNKLFAVPWAALNVDEDERCFTFDVSKEKLESLPGFDKEKWPETAQTGLIRQTETQDNTLPDPEIDADWVSQTPKTRTSGGGLS